MPTRPSRIAIVGLPNVGKSTLFNRLTGRREALVHDRPGMTRDRLVGRLSGEGPRVEIVDTGGMVAAPEGTVARAVNDQARRAVREADAVVLVVDGRAGMTAGDEELAGAIRRAGRPAAIAVNKLDVPRLETLAAEFHELGLGEVFGISAEHGLGIEALLDWMRSHAAGSSPDAEIPSDGEVRLALIGRPNVGKSSLLNRLLGDERVVVCDEPGTTRDPIDSVMRAFGRTFRLVDTAGLRQNRRAAGEPETLSMMRTRAVLMRCDVALLVLDAGDGITTGDLAIAAAAQETGRAIVPILNKWDLIESRAEAAAQLRRESLTRFKFLPVRTLLTVSAHTGLRVRRLLTEAVASHADFHARRSTPEWNRALQAALEERRPPLLGGRPLRLLYAVQTATAPPSLDIFGSHAAGVPESYQRFLQTRLRRATGLTRTPIRLRFRSRRETGRPS